MSLRTRCRNVNVFIFTNYYNIVTLFCFASFSSFYAFVEAAALRSIVLRYTGAPIATRGSFSFFGDVAFSEYLLYHFRFRVRRTFFPSEWCFSTL